MNKTEMVIPGCGNHDASRGLCKLMFKKNISPSLAKEHQVSPPGEIIGPGIWTVTGLICLAGNQPERQIDCSHFEFRTKQNDLDDYNW